MDLDPTQAPTHLESRLSYDMFKRYEPLLITAVAAFPDETSFTIPEGISPTTFVARFRDARLSYLKFNWPSAIDRDKLLSITGKYTISLDSATNKVWFRQKQSRGRPSELITETKIKTTQTSFFNPRWSTWTADELRAACFLINAKKADGPILLTGQVPDSLITDLTSLFDVSLVYDSSKDETILM